MSINHSESLEVVGMASEKQENRLQDMKHNGQSTHDSETCDEADANHKVPRRVKSQTS